MYKIQSRWSGCIFRALFGWWPKILLELENTLKKWLKWRLNYRLSAYDFRYQNSENNILLTLCYLKTLKSQSAMAEAMRGVTKVWCCIKIFLIWPPFVRKAMMTMNRQINLPAMQKIMMEFERQSEIMEMKEETIGDTSTLWPNFVFTSCLLIFYLHSGWYDGRWRWRSRNWCDSKSSTRRDWHQLNTRGRRAIQYFFFSFNC